MDPLRRLLRVLVPLAALVLVVVPAVVVFGRAGSRWVKATPRAWSAGSSSPSSISRGCWPSWCCGLVQRSPRGPLARWDRAPRREERRRRRRDAGLRLLEGQEAARRDPRGRARRAPLMPRIARASIDQVQATADMVEIVGQYTELRKAGANYSGRCPFHEERTPSFSVNPDGEALLLLRLRRRRQPVRLRAGEGEPRLRRGRGVPGRPVRHRARVRGVERSRRRGASPPRAPARAARAGHAPTTSACCTTRRRRRRPASTSRSAASATTSAASSVWASASPGWDKLREAARARKFSDQELLDAGLVVPGKRAALRPLPRAHHVPARRRPRPHAGLRGAHDGRREAQVPQLAGDAAVPQERGGLRSRKAQGRRPAAEDRVYVVEGYTDVLALVQAGVPNVVASMGTALTEQQLAPSGARDEPRTSVSTPTPPASAP